MDNLSLKQREQCIRYVADITDTIKLIPTMKEVYTWPKLEPIKETEPIQFITLNKQKHQ